MPRPFSNLQKRCYTTFLGKGTYGVVGKALLIVELENVNKGISVAIKRPARLEDIKTAKELAQSKSDPNYHYIVSSSELIKESFLHKKTAQLEHVAGGGVLIWLMEKGQSETTPCLIQRFFTGDGDSLVLNTLPSPNTTLAIFGMMLKGGAELEGKHIFHCDLKPNNILYLKEIVNAIPQVYIADIGGAYNFPPMEDITKEVLTEQLQLMLSTLKDDLIVKTAIDNIDDLNEVQILLLYIYCVTGGDFSIASTRMCSNINLISKIDGTLNSIYRCFESMCKIDHEVFAFQPLNLEDEMEVMEGYEYLRKYTHAQMVHQLALSTLSIVNKDYYTELLRYRNTGVYQGKKKNPIELNSIKTTLDSSGVENDRIANLFQKMIYSEKKEISLSDCLKKLQEYSTT